MADKPKAEGFNKLEVELYRYGTLVFGKIVSQSESLRTGGGDDELWSSRDGEYTIRSSDGPAIYDTDLHVRGDDKDADSDLFYYNHESVSEAVKFCKKIQIGIDSLNGKSVPEPEETPVSGLERVI